MIIEVFGPYIIVVLFIFGIYKAIKYSSRQKKGAKYAGYPGTGNGKRGNKQRTQIRSNKQGRVHYDKK